MDWFKPNISRDEMASQLIYQRVRNRVIEMLEWVVSCEAEPSDLGMNALINGWEDWVPGPLVEEYLPGPVFTETEQRLIRRVNTAIDVFCDATPDPIKDDHAALQLSEWVAVVEAAKPALAEMMARGRMPEEKEIQL